MFAWVTTTKQLLTAPISVWVPAIDLQLPGITKQAGERFIAREGAGIHRRGGKRWFKNNNKKQQGAMERERVSFSSITGGSRQIL